MMRLAAAAITILAFAAPSLQASGASAHVYNECNFDVNVWSVTAGDPGKKITIPANGGIYNETYRIPLIGGVSMKLTPEDNCNNPTPISQFEYTVAGGFVWYDISDINCVGAGCPFKKYGMYMHSGKGCPEVSCQKGAICAGAYNIAEDNFATRACPDKSDIHLYLCKDKAPEKKSIKAPKVKHVSRHFRHALRHIQRYSVQTDTK